MRVMFGENQKQTLETSSINQQVISTVKQTSEALKSLGLDESLKSVDSIMMEMEEMTQDVQNISTDLGAQLSTDANIGEDELAEELDLFLNADFENCTMQIYKTETKTQTPQNIVSSKVLVTNSMQELDTISENETTCNESNTETLLVNS